MKRTHAIISVIAFALMLVLSACGSARIEPASASPDMAESAAPAENFEPETSAGEDAAYQGINAYGLAFDDSVQTFLNAFGDADNTLLEIEPMLVSAASAANVTEADMYIDAASADAVFMWAALFYYINTYAYGDETVILTDNMFVISAASMANYFSDLFGTEDIPEIPTAFDDTITYDEIADVYMLIAASGEGLSYVIADITISLSDSTENAEHSAILTFDVLDIDGNVQNSVCVKIVPKANSYYAYTVSIANLKDDAL